MNELIKHIEALLQEHECVIVPDFGAFVLQHHAAEIREQELIPPRTIVTFNRALTHDDGLLVNAYARKQQLNLREAKKRVAQDSALLRQALQTQTQISLCRMGDMHKEGEQWVFRPSACTFLPQNIGFGALSLPQKESRQIVIRLRKDYLHYAAACVLGLCMLAISPRGGEGTYASYATLNPIDYTEIVLNRQAAETACEDTEETAERGHFHIVVASLDMSAARELLKKLQRNGYTDATILPYKTNLHRVVITSYFTKKEALRAMEEVRRESEYKHAWVYCEPS